MRTLSTQTSTYSEYTTDRTEPVESALAATVTTTTMAADERSVVSSRSKISHYTNDLDDEHHMRRNNSRNRSSMIATQETVVVRKARNSIGVVLLLSAVGVAVLVFFLTRNAETERFEEQYREDAEKVIQFVGDSVDLAFSSIDLLALNIAANARVTGQTWPNVTVSDFASRAEKTRALTKAVYVAMYMHVPSAKTRDEWEDYSAENGAAWVNESLAFQQRQNIFQERLAKFEISSVDDVSFWNVIHSYDEFDKDESEQGLVGLDRSNPGPFLPMWQTSPLIPRDPPYNWDLLSHYFTQDILSVLESHTPVIAAPYLVMDPEEQDQELIAANQADADWLRTFLTDDEDPMEPISDVYYPIIVDSPDYLTLPFATGQYNASENTVGALLGVSIYWRDLFKGILPMGSGRMFLVFQGSCSIDFTYEIDGPVARFLGAGDKHDTRYDHLEASVASVELTSFGRRNKITYTGIPVNAESCPFNIRLYPSASFKEEFITQKPILYSVLVIVVCTLSGLAFLLYNHYVERRNRRVVRSAEQTDAFVNNLLPQEIRDRFYEKSTENPDDFHDEDRMGGVLFDGMETIPRAELYPNVTIAFIDITGFTAWSSTREPGQVFQLLESIFERWDSLANRHRVMKVETVGDCYVAVVGLPEPRDNHAISIARFARDIVYSFPNLTRKLEVSLGPDTSDLKVRVGIHSGQVTGGLLRGTVTRYQLFGDTVNTAGQLLKTCVASSIHLSGTAAELVRAGKKDAWISKRDDPVELTGKGKQETFWLLPKARRSHVVQDQYHEPVRHEQVAPDEEDMTSVSSGVGDMDEFGKMNEIDRLVHWNAGVLCELLQQIVAARDYSTSDPIEEIAAVERAIGQEGTVLEEFQEIIVLPHITGEELEQRQDPRMFCISAPVQQQLRHYVGAVAAMYNDNAFHNFQHASHVTASVRKLLSRIVSVDHASGTDHTHTTLEDMTGHSYGITSDPLTQFAVVLSAVIHDCDHPGVPNSQLVKEKTNNSVLYKEKSVAEQNSVDLCWKLLMSSTYDDLRACIYHSKSELLRFRQLIVNVVMATDIVDKELGALRKARWNTAFSEETVDPSPELAINRKATIVLEHLIQASDVSHTMQHWDIYIEWNERFFCELYSTYKSGRAEKDPSIGWYEGEIGFFDFYIIPLAKKLDKCGVFGVSSHEYLDYAKANRGLWIEKGRDYVARFLSKFQVEELEPVEGEGDQ